MVLEMQYLRDLNDGEIIIKDNPGGRYYSGYKAILKYIRLFRDITISNLYCDKCSLDTFKERVEQFNFTFFLYKKECGLLNLFKYKNIKNMVYRYTYRCIITINLKKNLNIFEFKSDLMKQKFNYLYSLI